MLLHLAHAQHKSGVRHLLPADLSAALALARALHFPHLVQRLEGALGLNSSLAAQPLATDVPFFNDFMSASVSVSVSDQTSIHEGEHEEESSPAGVSDGGGYLSSVLAPGAGAHSGRGTGTVDSFSEGAGRRCDIDVLQGGSLDVAAVADQYMRMGRPVVLRGLLAGAISGGGWSWESLMRVRGDVKVTPSLIPYGDQLSGRRDDEDGTQKRRPLSLSEYMDTMRAYSEKVQAWVDKAAESPGTLRFELNEFGGLNSTRQFLEGAGLPYYVFDNQVGGRAAAQTITASELHALCCAVCSCVMCVPYLLSQNVFSRIVMTH
jgi:hypothetical protein